MSNTQPRGDAERNEMRTHHHSARAEFEQLLDGQPGRPGALSELMAAAGALGVRADTAGLPAALAVFANVSPPPAHHLAPRRPSMIRTMTAKLAAAKLLTLTGVAVAASGGIALAASTGNLPNPLPHSSHASPTASSAIASHRAALATAASSAQESSSSSASVSATASASGSGTSAGASASTSTSKTASAPSPSLIGLCHAWLAKPHLQGNADTSAAFTVLVTKAGGTDAVNTYCTSLLARPSPTATESEPGHSTGKPSAVPSATPSHPTGH